MPRFRRPPATPEQDAPAAEAYATNKLGSFVAVVPVAPRFRVSDDNNVLVFASRSWIAPAANAIGLLLLFTPLAEPGESLVAKFLVLLFLGAFPWLFYHHTVVVLNAAADDAQFRQKTIRGITRGRVPLSMLRLVNVETYPPASESPAKRAVLNFGQQQMPLSNAYAVGSAPMKDVAVFREWLAFHKLRD